MNNKLSNDDIKVIFIDNKKEENDDKNFYNNTIKKYIAKKNNRIFKVLIYICIILVILLSLKLFVFNNKNKFIKETTNSYKSLIEIFEDVDGQFQFLNSDYIKVKADLNLNTVNNTNNKYKINLIDANSLTLKISEEDKNIIYNKKFNNLNLFEKNNNKDFKYTSNLIKRSIYKSIDMSLFKKIKNKDGQELKLVLNDTDIKKILRRVLQKIKLNNRSVNLLSRYTNLDNNTIKDNINNLLDEINKQKFNDLIITIYYSKDIYKYEIKYDDYIITNNNNNNLIISKNNISIININYEKNKIYSNNDSKYKINLEYKDNDDKKIINSLFNDGTKSLDITLLYDIDKIEDNKYNIEIHSSVNSTFDTINSVGVISNIELNNKK